MIHRQAFLLQLLHCERRTKIGIPLLIASQHLAAKLRLFAPGTWLPTAAMHQARITSFFEAMPNPFGLTITNSRQSAELSYAQFTFLNCCQQHEPLSFLPTH